MKLVRDARNLFIFLSIFMLIDSKISDKTSHSIEKIKNKIDKQKIIVNEDQFLKRFRLYMKEIAINRIKSDNMYRKKLLTGKLEEGYPDAMIKEAKKFHQNKENWKNLMSFPTELWRTCIFPVHKMNYLKWCQNLYATKTQIELKCNRK
jgi:hypothetical protein